MVIRNIFLVFSLSFLACRTETVSLQPDGGAIQSDAAMSRPDAQKEFGSINEACEFLELSQDSEAPSLHRVEIEFAHAFKDSDREFLSDGALELLTKGNAGGSSLLSEVFAYEVLQRCEGAILLKTETEIEYDTESKITDFLTDIDTKKIGVSVTRAVAFPFSEPYPLEKAIALLDGKLSDILLSSASVSEEDRWKKQVLAILAYSPAHADVLEEAYLAMDSGHKADTIVYIVITNGEDDFIYCDGSCE